MTDPQISLLVPFRENPEAPGRLATWRWLTNYWSYELQDAEIIIGKSTSKAFSKTEAVNDAASRATGRTFVILDSDCYMRGSEIKDCADQIDESLRRELPLWMIPYRHLFRLTEEASLKVLASDPVNPMRFHSPPADDEVGSTVGSMHGHHFGAMIQIMPREAFETVGCMDPRFAGWGGEDVAFVRALDTLYAKHKTADYDVLHLWHPTIGQTHVTRMWEGQDEPRANEKLAMRYHRATGDRVKMRKLVNAGCRGRRWRRVFG